MTYDIDITIMAYFFLAVFMGIAILSTFILVAWAGIAVDKAKVLISKFRKKVA